MEERRKKHWTHATSEAQSRRVTNTHTGPSAEHHPAAFTGHLPGSPGERRIVGALFAAGLATFALLYSTQALLPELATDFRVTPTQSSLSLSLTTAGLAVALLVVGPLSDVIGRTRLIHASLPLAGIVSLLAAVAPTWHLFLGLRLLEGVVLAGLPAVATAYLREELHRSTQAKAAGLYIGGTAIGGMFGRLLTGPIGEAFGWRWALAGIAVLALGCAVVVRVALPPSHGFVPAPAGIPALIDTARSAFTDPVLVGLYVIGGCSMGALVALFNTLGFRLEGAPFDLGLAAASLVYLVYPLGTVSSSLFGSLAGRHGQRAVLPLGAVVAVVGAVLTLSSWLPAVIVGVALVTVGFFAVHGIASGWVPARAHAGRVAVGQAASFYLFVYYVGSSLFGSLATSVWSARGWDGVVALTISLFVVAAGIALSLRRTRHLVPQAA